MKKISAIQVYLDNSDYSRLASNKGSNEKSLFIRLRSLVENKTIQIRYSGITLLESAHNHQDGRDHAIARARVIEDLCKGRTFPLFTDLQRMEINNYLRGKVTKRASIYRECNQWLFKPSDLNISLISQIESSLYEALGARSRPERRRIKKELTKNGSLRRNYKTIIQESTNLTSSALQEKYPILKFYPIDEEIQNLLTEEISKEVFLNNISDRLLSPISFTGHLYDMYRNKLGSNNDIIRSFGSDFVDLIEIFRHEISKILDLGRVFEKDEKQIIKKAKSLSKDWLAQRNRVVDEYCSKWQEELPESKGEIKHEGQSIPPGELPGFDSMIQLGWQLACQKALDRRSRLSNSDG